MLILLPKIAFFYIEIIGFDRAMNGQPPAALMPPPGFSGNRTKKGSGFCKLVTPSTLEEQRQNWMQEVPTEFVDAVDGDGWAYLSLPHDQYWRVKLRKEGNKLWFHWGWSEYLQVLSVCVGFLMVFEYQGEAKFKVFAYDIRGSQVNLMHHMMSGASAALMMTHARSCSCPAPTPPSFLTLDQKPFAITHNNVSNNASATPEFTRRWRDVSEDEKRRALHASEMFHSLNPFFKVTLKPSYVYKGYSLHVPAKFAKKHLRADSEMIRVIYEGKEWGVKVCYGVGCSRLTMGWPQFAWQTRLEVDDVCVFELISSVPASDKVFMVTVFRVLPLAKPYQTLPCPGDFQHS